jgi:hypothetical protein
MTYLILILASILLFVAFLGLTVVEARTGTRVLAPVRLKLDKNISRISFVLKHVDWGSFLSQLIQSFFERVLHDVAHWSLIAVRFMERQLSSIVRYLRDRRPNMLAPKPSRTPVLTQLAERVKNFVSSGRK